MIALKQIWSKCKEYYGIVFPKRIRPPAVRPEPSLRIQAGYQLHGDQREPLVPNGNDLPLQYCLATCTAVNDKGMPASAIVVSMTMVGGEPVLVVNSITSLNSMLTYADYFGVGQVRRRINPSLNLVVNSDWSPICVPIECAWLPGRGTIVLDLMIDDAEEVWLAASILGVDGSSHMEYYGSGELLPGHYVFLTDEERFKYLSEFRRRLRSAVEAMSPEAMTCQV